MAQVVEDLILEELAEDVIGVSGNTLLRFAEAGYLKTQASADGRRQYFKSELSKVFGIKDFQLYEFPNASPTDTVAESNSATSKDQKHPPLTSAPEEDDKSNADEFAEFEEICASDTTKNMSPPTTADENEPTYYQVADNEPNLIGKNFAQAQQEITKFNAIINLQEKLLEARDHEIKDLREQRLWLQQRIEKLEEKASRDQLLLMTETQMLSKMIAMREARKNPLQQALGWLGFSGNK